MLKESERKQIIKVLSDRIGNFTCPICKKGHFSLIDGYSSHVLTDNFRVINLDGKMIPFVMLACNHCGFITQHAIGSLGLLDQKDNSDVDVK